MYQIGIDLGGSKLLGVICDEKGKIVKEVLVETPSTSDEIIKKMVFLIKKLRLNQKREGITIGLGAPGLVEKNGTLVFAPNLKQARGINFKEEIQAKFGIRIGVFNDATSALYAEWKFGAARGYKNAVMVTLGTGIGGGLVVNGQLAEGGSNFAGEIGHMVIDPFGPPCPCGRRGCWERFASGSGLARIAREEAIAGLAQSLVNMAGGDPEFVTGEIVTKSATNNDLDSLRILKKFGWWVGLGLANIAAILDPEIIVIGGGVIGSSKLFLRSVKFAFAELLEGSKWRPHAKIVAAKFGPQAGAVGAGLLSRHFNESS